MKPHAPLTCNIHPPPSPLRPPPKRSLPASSCPPPPPLSFLRWFASPLHLRPRPSRNVQFPEAVRFDGPFIGSEAELEGTEIEVETVVTRTLPPAVTLERGLQCIKEAVEELKLNPPKSRRGVLRFQVAVPPGPKALSWFCCQPESSGVFPTFFLSNENEESLSFKSLSVNQTRGVFGIGTSLYFSHSATGSVKRYLSSDSSLTMSYGFMDANFDMKLSSLKHETGSFYLVVPEIELHEHEDISALSATLAWDEILHFPFRHAIHSLESSLFQAASHFWPSSEWYHFGSKYFAQRKIDLLKNDFVKLVSVKTPMWADMEHNHDRMEPVSSFS